MKYQIVERDAFRVIGIKREIPCEGEGNSPSKGINQFWGESAANGIMDQLLLLNNGKLKGLLGVTRNYYQEKNTIDYWIATEHSGDVASEFSSMEFPASKWVVFDVRGPVSTAMANTWRQIYSEWFPSNKYVPSEIAPIEVYMDPDPDSPNSMNEIWVAIK
ncbi:GyrI-like domain-containing protein [Bacillus sp. FJAT-29814]|uniref:GyrI-like domain-containing protein n=1 Tax=Bacillus sp. FJAT-29814 TaxID=1729688 RepID=UPI000831D707|nr:GyrI-like domain-containing protein [Bacillus sp. FJAT-29814]